MKIEVYPSARNKNRGHKDSVFAYIKGEQGKKLSEKRYLFILPSPHPTESGTLVPA